jgi:hypothetical protein
MNISDALALNGSWCRLMLGHKHESFQAETVQGQVVGVVVPAPGLGVEAQLLLRQGVESVSPCGGGLEVFLSDVVAVLWWGDASLEQKAAPALRLV